MIETNSWLVVYNCIPIEKIIQQVTQKLKGFFFFFPCPEEDSASARVLLQDKEMLKGNCNRAGFDYMTPKESRQNRNYKFITHTLCRLLQRCFLLYQFHKANVQQLPFTQTVNTLEQSLTYLNYMQRKKKKILIVI